MKKLTFLEEDQIFGGKQLEIFKKRGTLSAITDFAILLGGYVSDRHVAGKDSLRDRIGWWWTKTPQNGDARLISEYGSSRLKDVSERDCGLRPVLMFSSINDLPKNAVIKTAEDGLLEVEYGYLPKWSVSKEMQSRLEFAFENGKLNQKGDN